MDKTTKTIIDYIDIFCLHYLIYVSEDTAAGYKYQCAQSLETATGAIKSGKDQRDTDRIKP